MNIEYDEQDNNLINAYKKRNHELPCNSLFGKMYFSYNKIHKIKEENIKYNNDNNFTNDNDLTKRIPFSSAIKANYSQTLKFNPYYNDVLAYTEKSSLNILKIEQTEVKSNKDNKDNTEYSITNTHKYSDHFHSINTLEFNENGSLLATGANDATVNIYDMNKQTLIRNIIQEETRSGVTCLDFNFSSNLLLVGIYDNQISMFDVRMGKPAYRILAHSEPLTSLSFSEDGKFFVSTSYDGFIRVWDIYKGMCYKTIALEQSPPISKAKYFANDDFILVSSVNSQIQLVNLLTEECLFKYKGHVNENLLVDFEIINANMEQTSKDIFNNIISNKNINNEEVNNKEDEVVNINAYSITNTNDFNYLEDNNISDFNYNYSNLKHYCSDNWILVSGSEDGSLNFWDLADQDIYYKYFLRNNDYELSSSNNNSLSKSVIQSLSASANSDILGYISYKETDIRRNNNDSKIKTGNSYNYNINNSTEESEYDNCNIQFIKLK